MDAGTGSDPSPSSPAIDSNLVQSPAPDPPADNAGASLGETASPADPKPKPKRKPRAANPKPKAAKERVVVEPVEPVVVDAHFFAGMSSTLKQLKRRDRELRLSALSIV